MIFCAYYIWLSFHVSQATPSLLVDHIVSVIISTYFYFQLLHLVGRPSQTEVLIGWWEENHDYQSEVNKLLHCIKQFKICVEVVSFCPPWKRLIQRPVKVYRVFKIRCWGSWLMYFDRVTRFRVVKVDVLKRRRKTRYFPLTNLFFYFVIRHLVSFVL